ncbi:hypothetical protein BG000_003517 [Podila horticola]|nr:hypothetical protein BG000_003517 [Podila horticola]
MPVTYPHSLLSTVSSPKVAFAADMTTAPVNIPTSGHKKRSSGSDIVGSPTSSMKRSISTPTMASASMVSTEQVAEFERHRQGQAMMTTYISSAIREKKQGNPGPYEDLIAQLTVTKPAPLTPAKLLQWIQALSQCISVIDKSCSALIDAMLQIDWLSQDDVFVQYYLSFLGNMVSAHAFYVVPVQSMLVKKLVHRHKPSTTDFAQQHNRVHQALKYILDLIPTGPTSLFPLLVAEFPHKRESIRAHVTFVKNILTILDYAPILREQVLAIIIDRIIKIDVEIQVELEELEDSDTEVVYDFDLGNLGDNGEDGENDSDSDSDSDAGSNSDSDSEAPEVSVLNIKDMTHKLDMMLLHVFLYLERFINSCRHLPMVNGQPPAPIQSTFMILLTIFNKTILQTFKSRHTQFLLFYYMSIATQFSDYFLGCLCRQILDKSQPQIMRIAAAAYLSSFVARAKYLDIRQVGMVVEMLGAFALQFVEQVDTGSHILPDAERYAIFYASVQALLYIFCFRWKILVIGGEARPVASNKDDFDSAGMIVGTMDSPSIPAETAVRQWHSGLAPLQRIVTSRLNPLKMCSDNVVKQFARLSNSLNFMYIYPILEQNKKIFIPRTSVSAYNAPQGPSGGTYSVGQNSVGNGAGGGSGGALPHELETFFPFDPYRLRQSARFMSNIYQDWENDEDEDEEVDHEEEDDELQHIGRHSGPEEDDEEDEDELEMNKSIMAMSISPSPAHFLVQGMTNSTRR